jgi:trk system potassium uptake protein TrkA
MAAKSFVVFGLGRFGYSVAVSLARDGCEVLAVDIDGDIVEDIANNVTLAVKANVKDQDVYSSLGLRNMDGAVVAVGGDMEASILATILSKEAGIPYVLAKASSDTHAEVLRRVGADQVILPEREMGSRVARNMVFGTFVDTFELSATYSMVELEVPEPWVGQSLRQLDVRRRYGVNVIAVREGEKINANMNPDTPFQAHQIILTVGNNEDLKKIK